MWLINTTSAMATEKAHVDIAEESTYVYKLPKKAGWESITGWKCGFGLYFKFPADTICQPVVVLSLVWIPIAIYLYLGSFLFIFFSLVS